MNKSSVIALAAALSALSLGACATDNHHGQQNAHKQEHKAGEASCGAKKKAGEASCGAKSGEAACGAKKASEAGCGAKQQ